VSADSQSIEGYHPASLAYAEFHRQKGMKRSHEIMRSTDIAIGGRLKDRQKYLETLGRKVSSESAAMDSFTGNEKQPFPETTKNHFKYKAFGESDADGSDKDSGKETCETDTPPASVSTNTHDDSGPRKRRKMSTNNSLRHCTPTQREKIESANKSLESRKFREACEQYHDFF